MERLLMSTTQKSNGGHWVFGIPVAWMYMPITILSYCVIFDGIECDAIYNKKNIYNIKL